MTISNKIISLYTLCIIRQLVFKLERLILFSTRKAKDSLIVEALIKFFM